MGGKWAIGLAGVSCRLQTFQDMGFAALAPVLSATASHSAPTGLLTAPRMLQGRSTPVSLYLFSTLTLSPPVSEGSLPHFSSIQLFTQIPSVVPHDCISIDPLTLRIPCLPFQLSFYPLRLLTGVKCLCLFSCLSFAFLIRTWAT